MKLKLRDLALDRVTLAGIVESWPTEVGLRLARLSRQACAQANDPMLSITTAMAAGMRILLRSNTRVLEVEAFLTGLKYTGGARRPIAFDLKVDGQDFARRIIDGGGAYCVDFASFPPTITQRTAPAERVTFCDLPSGMKLLELWLPHNAEVELSAIRVDAESILDSLDDSAPKWVHYGSSISQGKEVEGPSSVWPARVAQSLGLSATSLGFSGQCMLDGCVARTIAGLDAAVISLKLGANIVGSDTMRGRVFASALHNFLDIVRERHDDTPILIISPVISPLLEHAPGPIKRTPSGLLTSTRADDLMVDALTMTRVRAMLRDFVDQRRAWGDRSLHYLNGLALLGEIETGRLVDGVHPDSAGHELIAERMAPVMREMLV